MQKKAEKVTEKAPEVLRMFRQEGLFENWRNQDRVRALVGKHPKRKLGRKSVGRADQANKE
ncbi:MAG: hypothetical protein ACD_63C00056G0001 [uncultured bacterium]|nr:MAG: hypothetical protein ACD_63C00056G0001 [uncultured bacterium]